MTFFLSMTSIDFVKYAKRCEECQRFGPLSKIPIEEPHSIIKPWPFRGWAMDLICKINPSSSKCHSFVIVVTDYFTKWVKAQLIVSLS